MIRAMCCLTTDINTLVLRFRCPNFVAQHPFDNGDLNERDEKLLSTPRISAQVLTERANYYGMVSEVDFQIGRILDVLESSGKVDNTIIVFTSDNGLCVGNMGCWASRTCMKQQ